MALNRRIYTINTIDRLAGTSENFSYHLAIPHDSKFDKVVVLNVAIPISFYLIQEGFNTFHIRENDIDRLITLPPGNYSSAKTFALVLLPLLNADAPFGWIYSMSLPNGNLTANTGKFTYGVTGNLTQPSIICTNQVNEQLGFAINSSNTFIDGTLVSSTVLNFGSEATLYLHSDIASNGDSDILQEIYTANSVPFSYVTYQCTAPELYSKALNTSQSDKFQFTLTNEKNQILNLNGVDMQITLALYQSDKTNDLIQRYIKFKTNKETGEEGAQ